MINRLTNLTIIGATVGCVGCAPLIRELKKPPYPTAVAHHTRLVGIKVGAGTYVLSIGFFSETLTLIPCSTNQISMPAFSDRFKLGQSGLDTTIVEEVNSGWKDQPPAPMMRLFEPTEKLIPMPKRIQSPKDQPAHALSFTNVDMLAPYPPNP